MSVLTVLVIGGNRGIGLGFVQSYLRVGHQVYATYRTEEKSVALHTLTHIYSDKLKLVKLDVRDEGAIANLVDLIKGQIDILILNAGVMLSSSGSQSFKMPEHFRQTIEVNTIAPDNIMHALFEKLLNPNSCAVYISSTLGAATHNLKGRFNAYRASKTAGNMIMQNWHIELISTWIRKNGLLSERPCAFPVSPGVVQTDMGGTHAPLTVTQSVSHMVSLIEDVRQHKHCALYLYDGTILEDYPEPLILLERQSV